MARTGSIFAPFLVVLAAALLVVGVSVALPRVIAAPALIVYAGDDLCVRICGAFNWPITGYAPDATNFPELLPPGYPGDMSIGAWYYWDRMRQFELHGEIPEWRRVICGVEIPDWSAAMDSLRDEAEARGFTVNSAWGFETQGNSILSEAGSPWNQPPEEP
jgi:hypothetical protein